MEFASFIQITLVPIRMIKSEHVIYTQQALFHSSTELNPVVRPHLSIVLNEDTSR